MSVLSRDPGSDVEESGRRTLDPAPSAPRRWLNTLWWWTRGRYAVPGNQVQTPRHAYALSSLRHRLLGPTTPLTPLVWLWVMIPAVLGGLLRFVRLDSPNKLVFDETYYVKDAYSYLQNGVEKAWADVKVTENGKEITKKVNDLFVSGDYSGLGNDPSFVVHPPLGKWMIAWGMRIFGADNGFGWRFSAALVGTLAIIVLALVAYRLFASLPLAVLAGLFFAVDGHAIVQSRTALLDIFLMFWLLLAFGALLMDRYASRAILARKVAALAAASPDGRPSAREMLYGPFLGWRPWRLVAAVLLGCAVGTKWSALAFIGVFGLMTLAWDASARRVVGVRHWITGALLRDGVFAALTVLPTIVLVYLSTWTGWLMSKDGYDRTWAQDNSSGFWDFLPNWLRSLVEYHRAAYAFHQGLSSPHPYSSPAIEWLLMIRPTSYSFDNVPITNPDGSETKMVEAVTSLGNPLIWWLGTLALLVALFCWIVRRDWRAGAILAGIAAGYLPWFMYPNRTMFFFYAIAFEPFLILALVYVLGLVLGPPQLSARLRRPRWIIVGAITVLILAVSAFFLPIWTSERIPFDMWQIRMWLPRWI